MTEQEEISEDDYKKGKDFIEKVLLGSREVEARNIAEEILNDNGAVDLVPTLKLTKAIIEGKLVKPMTKEEILRCIARPSYKANFGILVIDASQFIEVAEAIFKAQRGE